MFSGWNIKNRSRRVFIFVVQQTNWRVRKRVQGAITLCSDGSKRGCFEGGRSIAPLSRHFIATSLGRRTLVQLDEGTL